MHAIPNIALQYSKLVYHKTQQEKQNDRQQVEEEVFQKPKGNLKQPLQKGPHREKRVIKLLPFICQSPYLRDYKDIIKDKLTHSEKVVVDYAFLLFDVDHPKTEELYEFNAPDKVHISWIDKEAIASMAAADNHLENSILDKHFFSKYLIQRGRPKAEEVKNFRTVYVKTDYQDNLNLHDYGIYTMCHMETYYGSIVKDAKRKVCYPNFTTSRQYVERQYTT
ncbi:hypothetical protein Cgig2_028469 [Carnegiea gigantea]|uniref:Uncharacterized protein n=1 Tax=Carnegiea gigantea TaxID=171969 RepID=A0A9Q1K9Y3_9CARY|nr:hypothetical protein Cgig2_028469 [Carnegiea gigantea]